jgi:hypothetical protein
MRYGVPAPRISTRTSRGPKGDQQLTVVSHVEYVGEVEAGAAFSVSSDIVNPSNAVLFPWLATMAPLYQNYGVEEFHVTYCTETTTGESGVIMMYLNSQVTDPIPQDKSDFMNNASAARSSLWEPTFSYSAPPGVLNRLPGIAPYFVNSSPVVYTSGSDEGGLSDLGRLCIATEGADSSFQCGELYISYTFVFATPHKDQSIVGSPSIYYLRAYGTNIDSTPFADANIMEEYGALAKRTTADPGIFGAAVWIDSSAATMYIRTNRIGAYVCDIQMVGTGLSSTMPSTWRDRDGENVLTNVFSNTALTSSSYRVNGAATSAPGSDVSTVNTLEILSIDATASTTLVGISVLIVQLPQSTPPTMTFGRRRRGDPVPEFYNGRRIHYIAAPPAHSPTPSSDSAYIPVARPSVAARVATLQNGSTASSSGRASHQPSRNLANVVAPSPIR